MISMTRVMMDHHIFSQNFTELRRGWFRVASSIPILPCLNDIDLRKKYLNFEIFQEEERLRRENLNKIMEENQRKIEEQNKKMAEERLKIIEEQMKIDQEKTRLKRKEEKKAKSEQKKILGKDNSRPKLSFALSAAI